MCKYRCISIMLLVHISIVTRAVCYIHIFTTKYEFVMVSGFQGALLSFTPTSKTMETDPSWKPDPAWGGRGVCGG